MSVFLFTICIITAVSMGFIVSSEYVFRWARKLAEKTKNETIITFVNCPVCLSWWAGLAVALIAIGFSWWVFPVAFGAALLARILRIFEG